MEHLDLTETQSAVVALAREIAEKKIKPVRAQYDRSQEMPWEIVEEFRKADMYGLNVHSAYGGMGGGVTELTLAVEELSRACGGIALALAASVLGSMPILLMATEEQRKRWLPDIASGKKLCAFALTEAEAGSDATSLKTTAVSDGDYYVVNGSKHFISGGKAADFYTVAVSTNPSRGARGISLLVIEKGTPGFTFGKKEDKMGIRANPTYELIFENVRVPKTNLLGSEGRGLLIVQETLDYSRPGVASQALGIAQGALDETVPYLRTRTQFGHPVSSFQAISHKLADLASKVEAGRALVRQVSRAMDREFLPAFEAAVANGTTLHDELKKLQAKRWTKYASMTKLLCSDVAMEVTSECVNLCGGVGYMADFPVEKFMRDAKITQIYEGTNHIQRNEIAAAIIKEYAAS